MTKAFEIIRFICIGVPVAAVVVIGMYTAFFISDTIKFIKHEKVS